MEIRAIKSSDLTLVPEIDATIESTQYLHLDKSGEGIFVSIKIEPRPLREKQITSNPLGDDLSLHYRQIATGADDGFGLVAEHNGQIVASAISQPDASTGTMRLIDLRVDSDFRRQGLGTAMTLQIIQRARDAELRAVSAEARTNNFPANQLFQKLGFDLSGIDARKYSNHDIVKETVAVFWYAALD